MFRVVKSVPYCKLEIPLPITKKVAKNYDRAAGCCIRLFRSGPKVCFTALTVPSTIFYAQAGLGHPLLPTKYFYGSLVYRLIPHSPIRVYFIYSAYLLGRSFFTHNVSSFIIVRSLHSRSGRE